MLQGVWKKNCLNDGNPEKCKKKNQTINEKVNDIEFIYLIADDYPPKLLKQFVDDQKNKYKQTSEISEITKQQDKSSNINF